PSDPLYITVTNRTPASTKRRARINCRPMLNSWLLRGFLYSPYVAFIDSGSSSSENSARRECLDFMIPFDEVIKKAELVLTCVPASHHKTKRGAEARTTGWASELLLPRGSVIRVFGYYGIELSHIIRPCELNQVDHFCDPA